MQINHILGVLALYEEEILRDVEHRSPRIVSKSSYRCCKKNIFGHTKYVKKNQERQIQFGTFNSGVNITRSIPSRTIRKCS